MTEHHHVFDCGTGEVRLVPFTAKEMKQRAADGKKAEERASREADHEAAVRDLVAALRARTASDEQVQQALCLVMEALL
jgi:hypothetical protein